MKIATKNRNKWNLETKTKKCNETLQTKIATKKNKIAKKIAPTAVATRIGSKNRNKIHTEILQRKSQKNKKKSSVIAMKPALQIPIKNLGNEVCNKNRMIILRQNEPCNEIIQAVLNEMLHKILNETRYHTR